LTDVHSYPGERKHHAPARELFRSNYSYWQDSGLRFYGDVSGSRQAFLHGVIRAAATLRKQNNRVVLSQQPQGQFDYIDGPSRAIERVYPKFLKKEPAEGVAEQLLLGDEV
jgi:hypothetical protein